MSNDRPSYAELQERLARAEETLAAIRTGTVDAIVGMESTLIVRAQAAEQALRESEERYRRISEMLSDYAYVFRVEANQRLVLDWVIGGFERITGFTPEESAVHGGWAALVHPDDSPIAVEHVRHLLAGEADVTEFRIVRKDGEVRWLRDHGQPVWDETQGRVVRIYGAVEDITERKQMETEHERLMTAIEQAGESILITDAEGIIQYVNPAFETVTGFIRREVIGYTPRILKSGEHDESFYRHLWETVSSGKIWQGRIVNKRKDGSLYTGELTISPVCDTSGRIVNYVAVKRDITEQLRLEAQLRQAQKMESVGRLAGGVAHDFNNILSVILGQVDLALTTKIEQALPLYAELQEIRQAAQRSADLTRQLLAFARKQVASPKVLNLNDIVAKTLKMLHRLIGEDINLVWKPGADLWSVKIDPAQVDQILANLCINSRDAITGVGQITIETGNVTIDETYCANHPYFVSGEYVLLAVSDNGCGMDSETLEKIFEPFFTTKEPGKGTGLGLATVYGIVKQNNGLINVYSEPEKGTTFKIYLPRHADEAQNVQIEQEAEIAQGRGETVLLVEDEPGVLKMGKMMLERLGYRVLDASTPGESIRLAEEHTGEIRLLITDVVMPGMNGRDLARQLQSRYPTLKCLFISGYTANVIADHGVLEGGMHFLQKPFSMKELAVKVRAALDET